MGIGGLREDDREVFFFVLLGYWLVAVLFEFFGFFEFFWNLCCVLGVYDLV